MECESALLTSSTSMLLNYYDNHAFGISFGNMCIDEQLTLRESCAIFIAVHEIIAAGIENK